MVVVMVLSVLGYNYSDIIVLIYMSQYNVHNGTKNNREREKSMGSLSVVVFFLVA